LLPIDVDEKLRPKNLSEDFMKKHTRTLLFTSALALFLSAALGLNAQSTPSTQPPDTQAQQPSPPETTPSTPSTPQVQATPSQTAPSQTTPNQTPEKAGQAAPDTSANGAQPAGVQSFSGTVVKSGDKYVLQDESGTTYDTDHQDEMAKFAGKRVKVHGTLDASGKMIHIQ
jgi:outer membrane biosynthesis protein TonB